MLAIAAQRHLHGIDRLHCGYRVALDARHLHQAADRVAGQAEVVFQSDFGSVLYLRRGRPQHFGEAGSSHGTGRTDLALAANFCTGNRRVLLAQDAHGGGAEEEVDHARLVYRITEAHVVVQHRRDDTGRAVGRRSDHAPASGVFFVDGQGEQVDPLHGAHGRADHVGLADFLQAAVQLGGAPAHIEPAGQRAFVLQAVVDAFLHGFPELVQAGADFFLAAPDLLIGHHQLRHAKVVLLAQAQQLGGAVEIVR